MCFIFCCDITPVFMDNDILIISYGTVYILMYCFLLFCGYQINIKIDSSLLIMYGYVAWYVILDELCCLDNYVD